VSLKKIVILASLATITASCGSIEIRVITPTVPALIHTLLPYPDALDVVLVHDAVTARVNDVRANAGKAALQWDPVLQDYALNRAWDIVRGAPYDEIDDAIIDELGEPVAELRACLSEDVTTPDAVAQIAVDQWLGNPKLRAVVLDNWERIGVGLDWGCPTERGVVLVVLLAGMEEFSER
jgi:uncharacterized protein YkwD